MPCHRHSSFKRSLMTLALATLLATATIGCSTAGRHDPASGSAIRTELATPPARQTDGPITESTEAVARDTARTDQTSAVASASPFRTTCSRDLWDTVMNAPHEPYGRVRAYWHVTETPEREPCEWFHHAPYTLHFVVMAQNAKNALETAEQLKWAMRSATVAAIPLQRVSGYQRMGPHGGGIMINPAPPRKINSTTYAFAMNAEARPIELLLSGERLQLEPQPAFEPQRLWFPPSLIRDVEFIHALSPGILVTGF